MSDKENLSNDQRELQILQVMRKVLSSVVKDTTPPPGMQHPLQASTIEDVKQCFALITAREKEIHAINGTDPGLKPRFKDERAMPDAQVVPFIKPQKKPE